MDAEFTDDQEALRASVRRYLDDHADLATSRTWFDRSPPDTPLPPEVWSGLASLGAVGMLVPEGLGGSGGGLRDLGVVLEELGRSVIPGPFVSTAVGGVRTILSLGTEEQKRRWLPQVCAGTLTLTAAPAPAVSATRGDKGPELTGQPRHVLDGGNVDLLLIAAHDENNTCQVFVVDRVSHRLEYEPVDSIDPSRRFAHLDLRGVPVERLGDGLSDVDVDTRLSVVRDEVHVALVLDALGSAEAALALAVSYAHERRQFGAAIGTFQAVQHMCADMLRDVETVRAAAYHAAWALDAADRDTAHHAATVARAIAADALPRVGATCIQVHGGIGFTWEHDAHRFYKRQLTMAGLIATSADPLDDLADLVMPVVTSL